MVKELQTGIQRVDKIFHLADIHIRNHIRHKEYREVFEEVSKYIQANRTSNSIIYVAGDIVHSKSDMSPELVSMLSTFFKMLVDLCPTLVILGNHDTNLNNPNRLNTLKPVIDLFNHPDLHFLNENGYYRFAQLGFNVMEVTTLPEHFLPADGLDTEVKIALHHGAVNLAITDLNSKITNKEVTIQTFNGHDLALLGDIHKRQFLQYRNVEVDSKGNTSTVPAICYPSSLIQQNHGEAIGAHGLVEWNLADFTYKEVNVKNRYGYYTLEVENGTLKNWDEELIPELPRFRVKCVNTSITDQKIIEVFAKSKRRVVEWSVQSTKTVSRAGVESTKDHINKIRDVEYQNKLIGDFFSKSEIPEKTLDLIRHINRITNSKLGNSSKNGIMRNISWRPVRFEFSNMFSYGENNVIDFTDVKGLYGIFGPNATGKSTLFDAYSFCLFDKCSKTFKAKDVINKYKDWFECKHTFTIDSKEYVIYKKGSKTRTGNIKVDIDFYTFDKHGNKQSLNGDQRDSTNKNIRNYIGTYEDFTLTVLSVQNNGTNFIEKPQRERRELLVDFLDIGVFEDLHAIATEDFKDSGLSWKVKSFKSADYSEKLSAAIIEREEALKKESSTLVLIKNIETEVEKLTAEKITLIQSLPVVMQLPTSSETFKTLTALNQKEKERIKTLQDLECLNYTDRISELNELFNVKELEQLEADVRELKKLKERQGDVQNELKFIENTIRHLEQHIKNLAEHEYNPECEYCVKHPTVKLGETSKEDLLSAIKKRDFQYIPELESVKGSIEKFIGAPKKLEEIGQLRNEKRELEIKETARISKLEITRKELELLEKEKAQVEKVLNDIKQQEAQLIIRDNINSKITVIEEKLKLHAKNLEQHNTVLRSLSGIVYSKQEFIDQCKAKLIEIQQITEEYEAYTLYLQAIKTDGVPYNLTNEIIPDIEEEINNMLRGVVDFKLTLETDNKNINAYIVYGEDISWPVESGSGMEKFISSLAIRTSLIANTSLPKPNFICIDEGFGALDGDNLSNIGILFQKMKENFETIFCISHIEDMKDTVDSSVYIVKRGNDSFVSLN